MDAGVLNFWGPVTSSINRCEKNYVYSSYIAEFYNPISNIPTILLAITGLVIALSQGFEKRFTVLHLSNMILAMGSILWNTETCVSARFLVSTCSILFGINFAQFFLVSTCSILFGIYLMAYLPS